MLTDNSVVVVDNIYRHITELNSPVMEASENATEEVTFSVIASALTTIVVFLPILFIPGLAREFFSCHAAVLAKIVLIEDNRASVRIFESLLRLEGVS